MRLLLFDIDHTLLRSGGAGFRAIERAIEQRYGIVGATDGVIPDGKTDPQILREIVAARHLDRGHEDAAVTTLTALYEELFEAEMSSPPATLLPGVRDLLDALANSAGVLLGLLTGNFERTARIKLATFGLDRYFAFGAYGSDHADRDRLPAMAVARAEAQCGTPIGLGRHVFVIGDTPRDIACGLTNGATAVGVASGNYSARELSAAGAHIVLADLSDTAAAVSALTG